jgi:hypothetical protein
MSFYPSLLNDWSVRVSGKPTLDIRLLLAHQDAWLYSS